MEQYAELVNDFLSSDCNAAKRLGDHQLGISKVCWRANGFVIDVESTILQVVSGSYERKIMYILGLRCDGQEVPIEKFTQFRRIILATLGSFSGFSMFQQWDLQTAYSVDFVLTYWRRMGWLLLAQCQWGVSWGIWTCRGICVWYARWCDCENVDGSSVWLEFSPTAFNLSWHSGMEVPRPDCCGNFEVFVVKSVQHLIFHIVNFFSKTCSHIAISRLSQRDNLVC